MRRPQPSAEHAEAVSRRLATLSAELAAVRREPSDVPGWVPPDPTHTRVRPREGEAVVPAPVVVPVPGRHAARRIRVGGLRLGPAHLVVVGVLAAVAVALAAWWAVRDGAEVVPVAGPTTAVSEPEPLVEVPTTATAPGSGQAAGRSTAGQQAGVGAEVVVDVAGRVRRPGIAVLPPGSRVVDALEAAGGARRGVDLSALNLARLLVDGEQILVGVPPVPGVAGTLGAGSSGASGGTGSPTSLVNLNTADEAALDTLPGVGPVTAAAILSWRAEHGGFTAVEELLEVDGIGEATLADLAPLVTL